MITAPLPPQGEPVTVNDVRAGRVAERHAQLAKRHGSVFGNAVPGGWPAGACIVLVGDAALASATGDSRAALSSEKGWAPLLGTRFGRAVINVDEPQHAQDRRRWAAAFTPAEFERCLSALRPLVASRSEQWSNRTSFDAYPATRELAFAGIATTLGGFADDATLERILDPLSAVLDPTADGESELDRHHRVAPLREALEALLRAHLAAPRSEGTVAPGLIELLRRQDPTLGDNALLAHLNLLLITGLETTASLMAWVLHYASMARWRAWLREELDAGPAPVNDSALAALETLPRLDAFVREAGRLHPPVVCAPRVCTEDAVIAGVRIPAGSNVVLGYGGTNLLAASYDDAAAFRPQRWTATQLPRAATFGGGHRLCIGMRFAQLELKAVLAHVVTRYDIEGGDAGMPVNAGFWNARPTGGPRLTLRKRHGTSA
ncbi:MAG: cytochrome P450 [Betaproteobacteria bacterium]